MVWRATKTHYQVPKLPGLLSATKSNEQCMSTHNIFKISWGHCDVHNMW